MKYKVYNTGLSCGRSLAGLKRRPVTAEIEGSNPFDRAINKTIAFFDAIVLFGETEGIRSERRGLQIKATTHKVSLQFLLRREWPTRSEHSRASANFTLTHGLRSAGRRIPSTAGFLLPSPDRTSRVCPDALASNFIL